MKKINTDTYHKTYKLLGIDDSARMPVVGSMFVAGILVPLDKIELLKKIKVKDSKLCTKKQITQKAKLLISLFDHAIVQISAKQISNYNMNDLEANAFYNIYKTLGDEKTIVYADNFDRSRETFLKRLKNLGISIDDDKWVIVHNCDRNFMVCSAASIIAKYYHNLHIKELHRIYGDIGSLNPGDPKTLNFIKKNLYDLPDIVRSNYITVKRLYQQNLC